MQIFKQKDSLKATLHSLKQKNCSIGFVPTMGALHQGHLSLIEESKRNNAVTVCSIFVNPTQFNNQEDLARYPRTLEVDRDKLKQVGCDILFAPTVNEMYPQKDERVFDFGQLNKVMEGKHRQGHFNGVALIVSKLFDVVQPDNAYFGEKDYQQLAIIKKLVQLMKYDINIIPCSTVREDDGLAMSSRNQLLSNEERAIAPIIYQTLTKAKEMTKHATVKELKQWVEYQIAQQSAMRLDYFEISDAETLSPIAEWDDAQKAVGCIAVFLGKVRLIDNIIF